MRVLAQLAGLPQAMSPEARYPSPLHGFGAAPTEPYG